MTQDTLTPRNARIIGTDDMMMTYIAYDFGERFVEGRMNFTHEGFEWHEELRGLSSRRNG